MISTMKEQAEIRQKLHETALKAPKSSGVYLWKDETGQIIYIGKAKSLKNRLLSYFNSAKDVKTRILVSKAHSIEYITTDNEYEALMLENTLIKKHKPRYNINLKDGKTYPMLKLTNEEYPRLFRTRRIQNDGAKYFGPFPNIPATDQFLVFIKRNYKLRQCRTFKKRDTPCLYYHIGRCSAPCCGKITHEEYLNEVSEIEQFLNSGSEQALEGMKAVMQEAAKNLQFEKAARIRDGIAAMQELQEQNAVQDMDPESRDYIAWASEGTMVTFAVLKMRNGRLVARDLYRARTLKDEEEILPEFLMAFYTDPEQVPPRIFVPTEEGLSLAEKWFREQLGITTMIQAIIPPEPKENEEEGISLAAEPVPGYGQTEEKRHTAAMSLALFNAREDASRRLREQGDFPALEELRSILNLPDIPSRIEGFDIAHIGGRLPVASLITFRDGNPDRKNYRMYRLRTTDGVIDDFASLREATARRYTRLLNENSDLPDLILIDGGIGQVNAVKGVLDSLGADTPVIGLAKQDEEIYLPGNSTPLRLPKRSDALRLLQRVRDETHRFATSRNQRLRTKENTRLIFESLPGVGPKKAVRLLKEYGSLENLAGKINNPEEQVRLTELLSLSESAVKDLIAAVPALLQFRNDEREKRAGKAETPADSSYIDTLARLAGESGEKEEQT
ncbi:excinuclease ABC subunit UvrC [Brucepastera parasyntrophica]|uniref:excinuclease ABC subunit UvrC n=1 Tax=Brucepastera parasyntrophica TaxID=2880008 RepID=UPI00210D1C89|nr:excinuclease ABC subunit UvrC [Brucepastera parasyntrophica]ULQ59379.1 excinuclease ABC subunit UvrC [Brucepastera parasyntrophica]